MPQKIKILFIYDELRTFVKKDLNIFREQFEVTTLRYTNKKDIPKLIWGVITTDINISWFALGYATTAVFLSKLFGKKSIVIAGGWDVVSMPEIGYGAMQSPKRVKYTKFTLKYADKVLTVSESTKNDVLKWVSNSNVEIVYHGFEKVQKQFMKENLVITVGSSSWQTFKLKGLDTFVKAAGFLPDVKFVLIGPHIDDSIDYLKNLAPTNVEFIGYTPYEKLTSYFAKAKVYVQISAQESFGSALAESMSNECVPVVTKNGALPEVVGDTGFYVPYDNPMITANMIKEALQSDKGKNAKKRIELIFPFEKRRTRFIEIIYEIYKAK